MWNLDGHTEDHLPWCFKSSLQNNATVEEFVEAFPPHRLSVEEVEVAIATHMYCPMNKTVLGLL